MKILTTYEATNAFPRALKLSQKDVVIVTNRGKPVAAIEGLKGEENLEDYLLERSAKFWAMIWEGQSVEITTCKWYKAKKHEAKGDRHEQKDDKDNTGVWKGNVVRRP